MKEIQGQVSNILNEINQVVIGKEEIIKKVLTAILAQGHILLEDVPGVGKTTLALAFSKAMELSHKRIQFTPDVLPSDVVGYNMIRMDTHEEVYKPGAVMCNLLLADEINRTSSKTQSALLEVMEEGKVTVDQVTRKVPEPFCVIATQNPKGSVGTQLLPDSQLDRFMVCLSMGYPDVRSEVMMLRSLEEGTPIQEVKTIITQEELRNMQEEVKKIFVHNSLYEYVVWLVNATRTHPYIQQGVSPRGTIALMNMAKATAYVNNRDYCIPDDVRYIFREVVGHRILLSQKARYNRISIDKILEDILRQVRMPKVVR